MNPLSRLPDLLTRRLRAPRLTPTRMVLALAVALVADGGQILLLPLAWTFIVSVVDVVAMVLTMACLGFHWLLLPTFVVEFFPVVDMLPTWTGCVVMVIAWRKKAEQQARPEAAANPLSLPESGEGPGGGI
jgi:hypothetical protein